HVTGVQTCALPIFLACFGTDGNKAFTVTGVGNAHDFAGRQCHRVGVVTDDIADQHHLGQAAAFAFGGVAHGAQITLVQVFQAGQNGALLASCTVQVVFDLDNRGHGVARL